MKQTDWKIIYSTYTGVAKRAIQLLSREAGKYLIRENGVYRIHILPCERMECRVSKNAFFIGCYNDSPTIQKFVDANEIAEGGFLVKVVANPDDAEGRFVILTAHTETELFYAVVSFFDDYILKNAPYGGSNLMPDLSFDYPLREYSYTEAPDNKTRSIFTWGHSINDYRAYIDNMARLKFNELILWNDYIPLNIDDIIDYAHSYGIKVILGYSWGWDEARDKSKKISEEDLKKIKESVISKYRNEYAPVNSDGIYFQSITETQDEYNNGKLIASMVTDMVNEIAEELWRITPNLRLIFGLHATSVKNRLEEVARVDSRIEILWEDCGEFPYSYNSFVTDEKKYQETLEFTRKLLELRAGAGVGLVFKGVMMLDWCNFVHQRGPYILGENASEIAAHDKSIRANAWRIFSANWMQNGKYVWDMLRFIKTNKLGDVNMCFAGTLDGGIYLPFALCAQMFRTLDKDYSETLNRVGKRTYIDLN